MSKFYTRKTTEQFKEDLIAKGIKYVPLDEYVDANTKIRFKCNECGHIWAARPTNILSGRGCPSCRDIRAKKKFSIGRDEFLSRVAEANPYVIILGTTEYSYHGRSLGFCTKHCETMEMPNSCYIKGSGCRLCRGEKIKKIKKRSHEDFVEQVAKVSPHIEVLGEYENARTKIKAFCKIHNEEYYVTADLLLKGMGNCPKCTMTSGEYKVANYLDSIGVEYVAQHSFPDKEVRRNRFDFYIPSLNTCIEYDGIQHFKPVFNFGGEDTFEYTKRNDEKKNKYCEEHGIRLIRIPYTEENVGEYLEALGFVPGAAS